MKWVRGASLLFSLIASSANAGDVSGSIRLDVGDLDLGAVGPLVAYLKPTGPQPAPRGPSPPPLVIRQERARFDPSFAVVAVNQRVEMPNFDGFFHNVFSFSRPNEFDLGLFASGETESVAFEHPGVVRIYCSIHESMSGLLLVTPTTDWARVARDGAFTLRDVVPGEYELTIWSEKLPISNTAVRVVEGEDLIDLVIELALEAP